ncbi:hypothetical protein EIP86_011535 [Pleurotus ostreatoroseus]|nr:hypothetical protein EIP86_011535 [Pleurotus ostreatoroseus]
MFYLQRANTGLRHTNTVVTRFIRLTLETGLLCAAFAILDLSFYCAFQTNNYHLAPSIPLSKLYSNSLLVVLNARVQIVGGRDTGPTDHSTLSYITTTRPTNNSVSPNEYQSGALASKTRTSPAPISFTSEPADLEVHIPMDDVSRHRPRYQGDIESGGADARSVSPSQSGKEDQLIR